MLNNDIILLLLLVCIALVLCGIIHSLYRIKRREDDILTDKTRRQVRLMARNSRLLAQLMSVVLIVLTLVGCTETDNLDAIREEVRTLHDQAMKGEQLDSAIIFGERLMASEEARSDEVFRQEVLEMLVTACLQHRDDELAMYWSKRLMDLRLERGDKLEALRNEAEIGLMLAATGFEAEGLTNIDSVIRQLDGKRRFHEMDVCLFALKNKITLLHKSDGETSDLVIATGQRILDILADYEQHPDEFHTGEEPEPPANLRPDYIDFYRSWAYVFMANAYARLNNKEKAHEYLALYEGTKRAQTIEGRKDIAPTYCLMGEFDKMAAIHAKEEARLRAESDTVSADYAVILHDRAIAAEAQGRYAEAFRLCQEYEALVKILNERLMQSKMKLYAARYQAQEQRREAERQKSAKERAYIVAVSIAVVALLALCFAIYAIRQRRRTELKNRVLVREITGTLDCGVSRDKRMAHACRLLTTHPEMSIRDVAEAAGFPGRSAFSSEFMKMYQITPATYRRLAVRSEE